MPEFEIDNGLVLSSKPLGDKKFIVSLFTKEKGRNLGVVKKKSPPLTASLFTGRWQARLPEQMGSFYLEDENPKQVEAEQNCEKAKVECAEF